MKKLLELSGNCYVIVVPVDGKRELLSHSNSRGQKAWFSSDPTKKYENKIDSHEISRRIDWKPPRGQKYCIIRFFSKTGSFNGWSRLKKISRETIKKIVFRNENRSWNGLLCNQNSPYFGDQKLYMENSVLTCIGPFLRVKNRFF